MRIANTKNMKVFFEDYMAHDGDWGMKEVRELDKKFRSTSGSLRMRPVHDVLEMANTTLHGHGVEEISGFRNSPNNMMTVAYYVNMGDTYNATIIYDCLVDKFYVGTYGDWIEWRQENKDYGLGEED